MKTLRECIHEADTAGKAVGHFNISNIEGLWAIFRAAKDLDVPVIVGTSEGERDFIGVRQAAALVKSVREEYDHPIYLNADHSYSFDRVKEAIDAGYDAVIFDGAKLSHDDNVAATKKCVEYARSCGRDVIVEAELGNIGQSSKLLSGIPEGVSIDAESLTKPEEARSFVESTGIDMLAPAVGNIHGMIAGGNPKLDIERIKAIKQAVGKPLVLHGGSGIADDDFKAAIAAGISVVHINTEMRVAFRDAVKLSLQENPDEVAPYKIMKGAVAGMGKTVKDRLKLFNNMA